VYSQGILKPPTTQTFRFQSESSSMWSGQ